MPNTLPIPRSYKPANWSRLYVLSRAPTDAERLELELIPGIKGRARAAFKVPQNAIPVMDYYLQHFGIEADVRPARGGIMPPGISPEQWQAQWTPGLLEKLRSWQRDGLAFGYNLPAVMFYHPTGSGKTWTAYLSALTRQGAVVEVTRSAPRPQHWRDYSSISRWEPFNCKPASSRRKRDRWQSLGQYLEWCRTEAPGLEGWGPVSLWGFRTRPVILLSWDSLKSELPALLSLAQRMPMTVIFDELHGGKSRDRWEKSITQKRGADGRLYDDEEWVPKDNRVAAAMQLSRAAARRIGTTATPTANRLTDWWGQLDLLDPWGWGSFWDFAKRYGLAFQGKYGMVPDNPNVRAAARPFTAELNIRKGLLVHEVSRAVVDAELPPCQRIVANIAVEDQCKPSAVKSLIRSAQKLGRVARMEARLLEAAARKRPWVQEMAKGWVTQGNGKVAIFTGRRREVEEWAKRLRTQFKGTKSREEITVIASSGEDSGEVRDAKRREYMAHPGPIILVATTDAWGESIDLQDTDVLCCTQLPYTPKQTFQLEGRVTRLGQERPVTIVYPIAEGTIDERLSAIMLEKLPDVEAMTEHGESARDLGERLMGIPDPDQMAAELLALLGVED